MSAEDGETAPLIEPAQLEGWIIFEDSDLVVINKPGWVVCHPSKRGPRSSLVGAVREYLGAEKLHLVARLDRETSGLVILAKNPRTARRFQMALQRRKVRKDYVALLAGEWPHDDRIVVDQPLARDMDSPVYIKQTVRESHSAQRAVTEFRVLRRNAGYTLCWVKPETGRKHQIRAHAEWLGCPVAGDKIYGPDPSHYLRFIETGWDERMALALGMRRQALHAFRLRFRFESHSRIFIADIPADFRGFAVARAGFAGADLRAGSILASMHLVSGESA